MLASILVEVDSGLGAPAWCRRPRLGGDNDTPSLTLPIPIPSYNQFCNDYLSLTRILLNVSITITLVFASYEHNWAPIGVVGYKVSRVGPQ